MYLSRVQPVCTMCYVCSCLGVYQRRRDLTTSMFSRELLLLVVSEKLRDGTSGTMTAMTTTTREHRSCARRFSCFPTRNCYVIPLRHRSPRGAKRPVATGDPDDTISGLKLRSFHDTLTIFDVFCSKASILQSLLIKQIIITRLC